MRPALPYTAPPYQRSAGTQAQNREDPPDKGCLFALSGQKCGRMCHRRVRSPDRSGRELDSADATGSHGPKKGRSGPHAPPCAGGVGGRVDRRDRGREAATRPMGAGTAPRPAADGRAGSRATAEPLPAIGAADRLPHRAAAFAPAASGGLHVAPGPSHRRRRSATFAASRPCSRPAARTASRKHSSWRHRWSRSGGTPATAKSKCSAFMIRDASRLPRVTLSVAWR